MFAIDPWSVCHIQLDYRTFIYHLWSSWCWSDNCYVWIYSDLSWCWTLLVNTLSLCKNVINAAKLTKWRMSCRDLIEKYKITQFYTAPTAIRLLQKFDDAIPNKYDLSSLRVLGSVGEPISPDTWKWYYQVIGRSKCAVVDTYWQTENGSFLLAPYPGVTALKAGSATLPQFGIEPEIVDAHTGKPLKGGLTTCLCKFNLFLQVIFHNG